MQRAVSTLLHSTLPFVLLLCLPECHCAQQYSSTASVPTLWKNSIAFPMHNITSKETSDFVQVHIILRQLHVYKIFSSPEGNLCLVFLCGFYCSTANCKTFLFGIIMAVQGDLDQLHDPQIVWSANRDHPVQENATVQFTVDGNLVLRDFDGTFVWSTYTSGSSVTRMTLLESGNLVFINSQNAFVWQSLDHPTDTLVINQTLWEGSKLTTNFDTTNSALVPIHLTIDKQGVMQFFIGDNSPINYLSSNDYYDPIIPLKGHILESPQTSNWSSGIQLPEGTHALFIRLEFSGHLRFYNWTNDGWNATDILHLSYCDYPLACGEYGICSDGQCNCPYDITTNTVFFRQVDDSNPNLGCIPTSPLDCRQKNKQKMISLPYNSHFYSNLLNNSYITSEEGCKKDCLNSCSCKAVFFNYNNTSSLGKCHITSVVYSISAGENVSYWSAYIKVQTSSRFWDNSIKVAGLFTGIFLLFIIGVFIFYYVKKYHTNRTEEEDIIPHLPGMPARFAMVELKLATGDFSKKLGNGGFGSVFEGKIGNQKVAVKRLHNISKGKDEFLAEVLIIGSIHHINLVRLIGYCAEKSEKLLVYEYMSNGSLEKWLFHRDRQSCLDWNRRRKIISNVAKGLLYLHEDCRQKIAHLDIKPENILLNENFDAKISDFGLAKLINRDQTYIITRMRGTPGYLAPEWLTHLITEKADVYSFGVVVIEMLCGRRNLDYTQPEENVNLISVVKDKIRSDELMGILDSEIISIESEIEDVTRMVKLAMWCLESDSNRRPAMSLVVKIIEGTTDFEDDLQNSFFNASPATQACFEIPTVRVWRRAITQSQLTRRERKMNTDFT